METFEGTAFNPDLRDTDYLHRIRLNLTLTPAPWIRSVVQVQDARVAGWRTSPVPALVEDTLDVRQAYVELGTADAGWSFRAGRQPLIFGEARLVSTSNWGNVGPNYDGGRISYRSRKLSLDWFGASVVRPWGRSFDHPSLDRRLYGFYSAILGPHGQTLEPYVFWKSNLAAAGEHGDHGHQQVYTPGLRWYGPLRRGFDFKTEMAWQGGHSAGDTIRAWAGHWEIGYKTGRMRGRPRFAGEYNFASGDHARGDGKLGTFDQLYPTFKWGVADNIGWRNIHEPIVGAEWTAGKRWKWRATHHAFWLADKHDALYNTLNTTFCVNGKATSSYVGQSSDLRITLQASKQLLVTMGGGHMFAGTYLKQSTRGFSPTYAYVMWNYILP
jgi:hypothetical protein